MSNNNHNSHEHNAMENQKFMNKINFLDGAMRKNTLPPEDILSLLPIHKKSCILDIGAGSGYLTIPAAKLTDEIVYALDIDSRMLNVIDLKAKAEDIKNIKLIQGNINCIPMEYNSVYIALASLILHEVSPLSTSLIQINRVLKAGGYILCMEYEKEENSVQGPPMRIRISSDEMERELISAEFHIVQKIFLGESIYIIIARK